jgi:hypothetical protein
MVGNAVARLEVVQCQKIRKAQDASITQFDAARLVPEVVV